MLQSSRRGAGSKMSLEEQFRYLRPLTEEDFRIMDAARYKGQERDIELGFRLREDVERELADKVRDQVMINAIRRQKIKGDHAFENLVEQAVCKDCVGLTDAIVWSTRVQAQACGCPSPSDDEGAPPSPPTTPPHTAHVFDDMINTSRREWLKERLLMELRGPYNPEFEDYTRWRCAKIRFSQISTNPIVGMVHSKRPNKRFKRFSGAITSQIRRLNRYTRSQSFGAEFFELGPHNIPQIVHGRHRRI